MQLSDVRAGQLVHIAPPVPQAEMSFAAAITHVLPLQQPGHIELLSQTHCPLAQRRPAGHSAF
jgi:hypothetical protein